MSPGSITLTVIPCRASSSASVRANVTTPALAAPYKRHQPGGLRRVRAVHAEEHQPAETARAHSRQRRRRQRDRRAEVPVDHRAVIVGRRRRERAHDDRADRVHDDVERAALRFHRGDQFRAGRKAAEIVCNGQHIAVVFGDCRAGLIRRRAAGAVSERDAVAGSGQRTRDPGSETRRRAGNQRYARGQAPRTFVPAIEWRLQSTRARACAR